MGAPFGLTLSCPFLSDLHLGSRDLQTRGSQSAQGLLEICSPDCGLVILSLDNLDLENHWGATND